MPSNVAALFQPFTCRSLNMPNRVVMAPMTRNYSPDGVPGDNVAAYYRRRAENGVGLIMTEGTAIDHPAAVDHPSVPHFYGEKSLAGWAKVVSEVHAAGGRIMPQLWHVGATRKVGSLPNVEALPFGPSGINTLGEKVAEPPSDAAIALVAESYGTAAGHAKSLGFDGVELHGAHGYLIDQFFWDVTNKRDGKYGSDVAGRTRFAVEAIQACRRAVGNDFPIVLRFSQWKMGDYAAKPWPTPKALESFLAPLVDAGVDIFHCSQRRFWEPEYDGSTMNLAGWTKKLSGRPTITVGSVGLDTDMTSMGSGEATRHIGIEKVVRMVEAGEVDLVAVGRALLADPAWAVKTRDGRAAELNPFNVAELRELV